MSKTIYIIINLLTLNLIAIAKPTKEIQIGVSYNTMRWKLNSTITQPYSTIYKYNCFNIRPNIRYSNTFQFHKFKNLKVSTFLGYSNFGGKLKSDTSNYKQIYSNHSIELGLLPSYTIKKYTLIGIGVKVNYTPLVLNRNYGTINQSDSAPRKWITENVSDRFKNISTSIGINMKRRYQRFSLGFEAWFGISNLSNLNSTIYKSTIIENNFRLIFSYNLSKQKN